jgi:AcrR family transcriptional regulator
MKKPNTEDQGHNSSTRDRLVAAALEVLLERGYRGATSRVIAQTAGVNEVTLFRLFSTRDHLLATAAIRGIEADQELAPEPTGDLEADLEGLAEAVSGAQRSLLLLKLWPEIRRLPEQHRTVVLEAVDTTQRAFERFFGYYQERGDLSAETGHEAWAIFAGPMLTISLRAELRQEALQWDPKRHVRLFLQGCGTRRESSCPQPAVTPALGR